MRGLQADIVSFVRIWLRRVRLGRGGGHTGGSLGGFAWRGSLGGYARGGWLWGRGGALGARLGYSLLEFALGVWSIRSGGSICVFASGLLLLYANPLSEPSQRANPPSEPLKEALSENPSKPLE